MDSLHLYTSCQLGSSCIYHARQCFTYSNSILVWISWTKFFDLLGQCLNCQYYHEAENLYPNISASVNYAVSFHFFWLHPIRYEQSQWQRDYNCCSSWNRLRVKWFTIAN